MMNIFLQNAIRFAFLCIILDTTKSHSNITKIQNLNTTLYNNWRYHKVLKNMLLGYDCSKPYEITNHEFDSFEDCNKINVKKDTRPTKVQILQETDGYINGGIYCSIRRTRKVTYCGMHHHGGPINSEETTLQPIFITGKECKTMYERKAYSPKIEGGKTLYYLIDLGVENQISYYYQGSQQPNKDIMGKGIFCQGKIYTFDNGMSISNIVIHHTDVIKVERATLIVDDNDILHKERQTLLKDCSPGEQFCRTDDSVYIWADKPPNCKLMLTKAVTGEMVHFESKKYFMSNTSLIHLELIKKHRWCEREIWKTDFKGTHILELEEEEPIKNEINAADVSIFKDFSVRNKWIYSKLSDAITTNIRNIQKQHCLDNAFAHIQYSRLHSKMRENLHPFTIKPRIGEYILPIGESLYNFKCKKVILRPVEPKNGKCYNLMPVTQINPDFTSINEEVLFLTPHDRIIMPTAEEIPCSNFFATKFSTIDNEWIALTKTGIIKTTPPEKQIKWLTMDWKIKDDIKQISFDIDSGLYSFDKVEGFEKMLIHSAIKNSKVSKLVQPIKMNRATDMEQVIEPGDIFTTYPWNALKQTLINTLMIFGQYCSIIIGIYSIISIIRAIYVYVTGFCIARRTANGIKDLLNYAFSPTNFALTKLTTNNKKRDIDDDEERTPLDIIKTRRSDMIPDGEAEKKLREIKQLKQEFKPL